MILPDRRFAENERQPLSNNAKNDFCLSEGLMATMAPADIIRIGRNKGGEGVKELLVRL